MKTYFLASLDLAGRPCLVVGGGAEATEKTARLLEADARVTVISPHLTSQLAAWVAAGRLEYRRERLTPETVAEAIEGFSFIINTVKSDPVLARRLYECCEARRILISAYDQPLTSNVVMPALVRCGRLRIGIATGATSPAVARRLREDLETIFDDAFAAFLDQVGDARRWLAQTPLSTVERRAMLAQLLDGLRLEGRIVYPDWFRSDDAPMARFCTDGNDGCRPPDRQESAAVGAVPFDLGIMPGGWR